MAAGLLGACSTSLPSSVGRAPVLRVATGLYPLAQAASMIGGAKVSVDDVVPAGSNPLTFVPPASQARELNQAALVVLAAPGFQPGLEPSPPRPSQTVWLARLAGTTNPYVWLDPGTMERAVTALGNAMERADPLAAPLFEENVGGLEAEVSSLRIDFSSTLTTCANPTFFTADTAFSTMANDFGLTDHVIGTSVAALAPTVDATGVSTVFAEPWIDDSTVSALAAAAHVKVRALDTLAGIPAGGWPPRSTYFSLMEEDLAVLGPSMGCPTDQTQ